MFVKKLWLFIAFFTLKILNFGRYLFIIVLSVISNCTNFVLCGCRIMFQLC